MARPKTPSRFTTTDQLKLIVENDYILDCVEYNKFEVDEMLLNRQMSAPLPKRPDSHIQKVCACCKDEKSVSRFHKNAQNVDGLHSYCKDCRNPVENKRYNKGLDL